MNIGIEILRWLFFIFVATLSGILMVVVNWKTNFSPNRKQSPATTGMVVKATLQSLLITIITIVVIDKFFRLSDENVANRGWYSAVFVIGFFGGIYIGNHVAKKRYTRTCQKGE